MGIWEERCPSWHWDLGGTFHYTLEVDKVMEHTMGEEEGIDTTHAEALYDDNALPLVYLILRKNKNSGAFFIFTWDPCICVGIQVYMKVGLL